MVNGLILVAGNRKKIYMFSKLFLVVICTLVAFSTSASAMTFSQPVKIGSIGWSTQSPLFGLPINGATYNDGTTEPRDADLKRLSKLGVYKPEKGFITYIKGTAAFGSGVDALYCKYDISDVTNSKYDTALLFGGKNNYVLTIDAHYKEINRITSDGDLTIYTLYHNYGVSHLHILGKRSDGSWVLFVDSKNISKAYFGGNEGYKLRGGIIYDEPTTKGDTIIVKYCKFPNFDNKLGEFRFKWDEVAQWFGVEQVVY